MLVSFIIPAYNAADTIERCFKSIYQLSLKRDEFEVIVIDDCSTDNTVDVVENLTLGNSNLTLLRQAENHRQGAARNRGVKIAKGEYICFVDADDVVKEGVVDAIRLAHEKQTDLTAFCHAYVDENGAKKEDPRELSFVPGQLFTGIELQNKHPYWCSAPVAYIYRREFLEQTNYPFAEDVLFEDSDFVAMHLYHAKRMVYSPELAYDFYYREGSTTHSMGYKNLADYLFLGMRMLSLYERIIENRLLRAESQDVEKFAEGILEGACYNVFRSLKNLIKLNGIKDVKAFYSRMDSQIDRLKLSNDQNIHRYNWNIWSAIALRHRAFTITILAIMIPSYKLLRGTKRMLNVRK